MCGFVGVVRGLGRGVRREEFGAALPFVSRRGPDGTGVFVDGEIGLLATRLAIQGGREGDQPLRSTDGRFVLAYNGELFASHRRLLRGTLRAEGAGEVRAVSDSALLLAWLVHRLADRRAGDPLPASAFESLRGGMYAFALVDLSTREVFLHTDGSIKPLHVAARTDAHEVWFASTPGALWASIGGARTVDMDEWAFRLVCPDGRRPLLALSGTTIEEVRDRVLVLRSSDPGRAREATIVGRAPRTDFAPPELDEVREAFEASAREAAETSGPVSIFLSGGLDSAAVAAWCGRSDALALTGRFDPIDGPFDESADAAAVAASAGLRHEVVSLSDRDLLDDLVDVVGALEDPSGGPGSLAIHRMAHRARATVAWRSRAPGETSASPAIRAWRSRSTAKARGRRATRTSAPGWIAPAPIPGVAGWRRSIAPTTSCPSSTRRSRRTSRSRTRDARPTTSRSPRAMAPTRRRRLARSATPKSGRRSGCS